VQTAQQRGAGRVVWSVDEYLDGRDLPRTKFFLLGRVLDEPREEAAVIDQRLPHGEVPVLILCDRLRRAGLPTQEDDNRVCLGRDEPEEEHVPATAVVALESGFPKGRVLVQRHLHGKKGVFFGEGV
jgi:hypothetical protein